MSLGYGLIGATLYAFAAPEQVWVVATLATALAAVNWVGWGFFLMAIALSIGLNWSVDSGLGIVTQLVVVTGISVILAGAVGVLALETRHQLTARFPTVKWRPLLVAIAWLGLGLGSVVSIVITDILAAT